MVDRNYHTPVLAEELTEALLATSPALIVDATLGGGGHARWVLENAVPTTKLIGLDQDEEALAVAARVLAPFGERIKIVNGNFRDIAVLLGTIGIQQADAIYADLGVSSHQIDLPERGFSYLRDGALDMRMNLKSTTTAADLLRELSTDELSRIFKEYGEERFARKIARRIEQQRERRPLQRTADLVEIIDACVPGKMRIKSLSRIFQALRIAVNDELAALRDFLYAAPALLSPGGMLAVISYHSLEDRQVKNFFREKAKGCVCPPELPVCMCGRQSELSIVTRKAVQPGDAEVRRNPRARSARLRIAQKWGAV